MTIGSVAYIAKRDIRLRKWKEMPAQSSSLFSWDGWYPVGTFPPNESYHRVDDQPSFISLNALTCAVMARSTGRRSMLVAP